MVCKYCDQKCQKAGKQQNGRQRYYCTPCKKYQQERYQYAACKAASNELLITLVCESVGIRGIGRVLKIATSKVLRMIRQLSDNIEKPSIPTHQNSFEVDEICTYIGNKEDRYWVAYALCHKTKKVIDFVVGKRTRQVLAKLVEPLLLYNVRILKTDRLNIYRSLIPITQHVSYAYQINHIERNNLTIRTHLKRLTRRTICFSKSTAMLEACLKIYFWRSR